MVHILLTGEPRRGKTTLLKETIKDLSSCSGFYTEEIISNLKIGKFTKEGCKDIRSKFK